MNRERVQLVEVGPRDGLQNEATIVSTEDKLRFIAWRVEATAFVHPKWVPQMADARALYPRLPERDGIAYAALVPNRKGLEVALAAGVREIAVFTAVSESFNRKNINMSIEESLQAIADVSDGARAAGVPVRGYLSTCFGCPYEGRVPAGRVAELTARLLALGCYEVSVSDTVGVATPRDVDRVLDAALARNPVETIALHLHDTRGTALANTVRALERGVRTFDGAAGGAGGCPFAPGALGNVATEDVVYLLEDMGYDTGIALPELMAASRFLEGVLGKKLPSRVLNSPFPPPGKEL